MGPKSRLSIALSVFQDKQKLSNQAYLRIHPSSSRQVGGRRSTMILRGTTPPAKEAHRDVFIARLSFALNEQLSDIEEKDFVLEPIIVPRDYVKLLELADEVHDIDLRGQGVAGIAGVCGRLEDEQIKGSVVPGQTSALPCAAEFKMLGWQCRAGFVLGLGGNVDEDWCCYCYCREGETGAWRWLIWYREAGMERAMTFNGVVAWMRWHGDWWDRANGVERGDMDEMMDRMRTMHGDDMDEDESDEEEEGVLSDENGDEDEEEEGEDDWNEDMNEDDDEDEDMEDLEPVYKAEQ